MQGHENVNEKLRHRELHGDSGDGWEGPFHSEPF